MAASSQASYPSPRQSPRTSASPSVGSASPAPSSRAEHDSRRATSKSDASTPCRDSGRHVRTHSVRRDRDPPKNEREQLFCDHADCRSVKPTFIRRCEWNKHMDKHERPYRCHEVECEKLKGFTYSGGLLRHERECHGKHGGLKKQLMCPHSSCKRSSGPAFTRLENLNEHLRRVHQKIEPAADEAPLESSGKSKGKRKQASTDDVDIDTARSSSPRWQGSDEEDDELHRLGREVKRLRKDSAEMKAELRRQAELLSRLVQKGP